MSSDRNPPTVCAIVVTYNGEQWVDTCLNSLKSSQYPVKTIVVDNNSTDNTLAILERSHPEIQLIKSSENLGFGKANNKGIAEALAGKADYVFLLNQDAWVESDTLGKLVGVHELHPDYGIISPLHYSGSGEKLDRGFENCLLKEYSPEAIQQFIAMGDVTFHRSGFINAAAWMISRSCLENTGGFGYLFFHYGEDHDYIQRMEYAGYSLGFLTGCRIFHDRENREPDILRNSYKKLVNYYYIGSIFELVNIKRSAFSSMIQASIWSLKELVVLFFRGRFIAAPVFFAVTWQTLGRWPEILSYRKLIKSKTKFLFLRASDAESI